MTVIEEIGSKMVAENGWDISGFFSIVSTQVNSQTLYHIFGREYYFIRGRIFNDMIVGNNQTTSR